MSHDTMKSEGAMPIAIVGMGCRLPGGASSPEKLWDMLTKKRSARREIPSDRFNIDAFWHPNADKNGTMNNRGGYFLEEDIAAFDAPFFSISPAEAVSMDPLQRMLLEVTYEAIESAGIPLSKLAGSNTGCYVGNFFSDYDQISKRDPETLPKYHSVGIGQAILSNRLSYCFGLQGPSISVDTACSSSLIALHLACQSLRTGEAQAAIVGATNAILNPDTMIGMTNLHFLSEDSTCHTFDERANGYARGEGMAALVLKPLSKAIEDGDTVRAIIRGTSSNSIGHHSGITVPKREAQVDLIRTAYRMAGCDPAVTAYCEAHGTGTQAGDPVEVGAIGEALGTCRQQGEENALYVGSVKTNIGHLEGASGLAAIIKAVKSLENGVIAPNLEFEKGNKRIDFDAAHIRVPTESVPWPVAGVRRVSVNSFGYGGANGHVILDDAYHYMKKRGLNGKHCTQVDETTLLMDSESDLSEEDDANSTRGSSVTSVDSDSAAAPAKTQREQHPRLFYISSHEFGAAEENLKALAAHVDARKDSSEGISLDDLAYTLCERRSSHEYGLPVVAATPEDFVKACLERPKPVKRSHVVPEIGFIFTGQGAQWWAMGRELIDYPVFSHSLHQCDRIIKEAGSSWSLVEEFLKPQETSRINEAEISQPMCTALQVALVDLLSAWGVRPTRVVGHSSGEIAAAYATGALTVKAAMRVAYFRGLMSPQVKKLGFHGSMLAAGCSESEALEKMAEIGEEFGSIGVACVNSPRSVTISGDTKAIDELRKRLTSQQIFARKLQVETAYHSHHMEAIADQYRKALFDIEVAPWSERNGSKMFSSVFEREIKYGDCLGGDYWVQNMVSCVRFSGALQSLCKDAAQGTGQLSFLVELGPHSALAGPVKQILAERPESIQKSKPVKYFSAIVREKGNAHGAAFTTISAVGALFVHGCAVNLHAVNFSHPSAGTSPSTIPNLPTYRWNHSRQYWAESRLSRDYRFRRFARTDILGAPSNDWNPLQPRWRNFIRLSEQPWLKGHVVQGATIYPAAGFCCMALEAAAQMGHLAEGEPAPTGYKLREVQIKRALVLSADEEGTEVSFTFLPARESGGKEWRDFCIFSYTAANGWAEHCRGSVSEIYDTASAMVAGHDTAMHSARRDCKKVILRSRLYAGLNAAGLQYGPDFQGILKVDAGSDRALATVRVADTASSMPHKFEFPRLMHPATMDTFLQMGIAAITQGDIKSLNQPYVPMEIEEVTFSSNMSAAIGDKFETLAHSQRHGVRKVISNITAKGRADESFISMTGVTFVSLAPTDSGSESTEIPHHFAVAKWAPDVDLMAKNKADALLWSHAPKDSDSTDSIKDLELVAFYYFQKVLATLTESDIDGMEPHHQKFVNYMKKQRDLVQQQQHEQWTDEWSQLTAPETMERIETLISFYASDPSNVSNRMFIRMAESLVPILRKEIEPLSLIMRDNLLFQYYSAAFGTRGTYPQVQKYISLLAHKNPNLEFLEIGAGTGGCTEQILNAVTDIHDAANPYLKSYTFTDVSAGFLENATEKFADWRDSMVFAKLDIEKDPQTQAGFEDKQYDIIVAANVLHATYNMENTMRNVRKLLRTGGKLILLDMTHSVMYLSLIFGNLPGWWNCSEAWREFGPLLPEEQWNSTLRSTGFSGLQVSTPDSQDQLEEQTRFMVATAVDESNASATAQAVKSIPVLIVTSSGPSAVESSVHSSLVEHFQKLGVATKTCTLNDSSNSSVQNTAVVCIAECSQPVLSDPSDATLSAVKRLTSEPAGVAWVSNRQPGSPDGAVSVGLARSLRAEREDIPFVTVEIDAHSGVPSTDILAGLQTIINSIIPTVEQQKPGSNIIDREFQQVDGLLQIKRASENRTLNQLVSSQARNTPLTAELHDISKVSYPLKAHSDGSKSFDNLHWEEDLAISSEAVPAGFIDIDVRAISLDRRDLLARSGDISDSRVARECAGVIKSIGKDVTHLAVGDKVVAWSPDCLCTVARVPAERVQKLISDTSFSTAASLPIAITTAYYSFTKVARIGLGDTVLIASAASTCGQAALQFALAHGSNAIAVVGNESERSQVIKTHDILESCVLISTPQLYDNIHEITSGHGLDIAFSLGLSGEALRSIQRSMSSFGHFIQVIEEGVQDTAGFGAVVARNVTYSSVDMTALLDGRPELAAKTFSEAFSFFQAQRYMNASNILTKPISKIHEAGHSIQSGKGSGKAVLSVAQGDLVRVLPRRLNTISFQSDASYLLSGGLGGIGRSITRWMVKRGARNLVFTSRRGVASPEARALIRELENENVRSEVLICDVANEGSLSIKLARTLQTMPPLHGVIQCAMALHDNLFASMSHSSWVNSLRPKVQGSWALHQATIGAPLDFFVMLGSCVAFIGNPGQSNYVAGGNYQVALAAHRRALGLPATTIDLGKMDEVGVIAENAGGAGDRNLSRLGLVGINEKELMSIIEVAMLEPSQDRYDGTERGHLLTGITSSNQEDDLPFWSRDPVFSHMDFVRLRGKSASAAESGPQAKSASSRPLAERLGDAISEAEGIQEILDDLQQKLARSLQMTVEEVDPHKSVSTYGVDSLIAVEVRNWFLKELKVQVPVFQIVQATSLHSLAEKAAAKCPFMKASTTAA